MEEFHQRPKQNEIRITNVPERIFEEANFISENTGVPLTQLLKSVIREWVDRHPEHMRRPRRKD